MPEGLEAEIYRRAASELTGARITRVVVDSACGDHEQLNVLVGGRIEQVRRHGKHVLVETTLGVLGIHFGMTGRLVVDGVAPIESLEYGSARDDPRWDRLVITVDHRVMRVNDPRRWSRYVLDPDVSMLGVDLFESASKLRRALAGASHRSAPVKSVLLDQSVIAGIGNLIADEVLFSAGIRPSRPFKSCTEPDLAEIARSISSTVRRLDRRGGSHTGHTGPAVRAIGARCPKDGTPFERGSVAGRTTLWCPVHQR